MDRKKCSTCKEIKDKTEFYKNQKKDGLRSQCKICSNISNKNSYHKYIIKNRIKKKQQVKKRYKHGEISHYRKTRKQIKLLRLQREYNIVLKCSICGYDKYTESLDFHHKDKSLKEGGVRHLLNCSWDRFIKEALKCEILCSNCHRHLHTIHGLIG